MSDVNLSIGGRNYSVACADGEEDHVRRLATVIDGKLSAMGGNLSPNDAKNLLFAALMLADEVEEVKMRPEPVRRDGGEIELNRIAGKLENIARALENAATTLESAGQAS